MAMAHQAKVKLEWVLIVAISLCLWSEMPTVVADSDSLFRTGQPNSLFTADRRVVVTNQAMGARCVVSADFDGDGRLDLVSASSDDNAVSWFQNLGGDPPMFSIKKKITWSSLGSRIVTTGDVDGDGDVDVIGASYYDSSLRWYENDGAGSFTEHLISSAVNHGQGVTMADLDNDGDLDVASASSGDNTIAVFKNIDRGVFCEVKEIVDDNAIGARTVIAADLDGDGWLDLASASKDDDSISWYPNDGTGHYNKKIVISVGEESKGAYSMVATDIDNDGDQDLVVASNGNDHVSVWRNDGQGNFSKTLVFDDADFVLSVTAADFDRDGDVDIASASYFDGHLNWYENIDGEGYEWRNHTIYIGTQGHYVYHSDVDGDGDFDLIAVDHAENTVTVFLAETFCDANNTGAECCLEGSQWNGTSCDLCSMGKYGIGFGAEAKCVECPKNQCTISGLARLPTTCGGITGCIDVEKSVATCSCPANTAKDSQTDSCTVCPGGQLRPDIGITRGLDTLGNYTAWEIQQGFCAVPEKKLPPPNYNYLDRIRPVGLTFAAVTMVAALVCGVWTQLLKENRVVKVAQPFFLRITCAGCMIMASSIIPLSIDDNATSPKGCSVACMAFPWLLSIGFTTVFAALSSKIWRLNKVFRSSMRMQRVMVKTKDAMIPFVTMMTINCALMLAWTLVDPLVWVRTELNENNESQGYCASEGNETVVFLALILIVNFVALLLANIQAFQARRIVLEDYSESTCVFLIMGSLLQALVIGVPLLLMVSDNYVATYFLWSAMIFLVGTSALGLLFIPKMIAVRKREVDRSTRVGPTIISGLSSTHRSTHQYTRSYHNNAEGVPGATESSSGIDMGPQQPRT